MIEYYTGDFESGFFSIIEEEYFNGGSDWYTYLSEKYPDVVKDYIDVEYYPNWRA